MSDIIEIEGRQGPQGPPLSIPQLTDANSVGLSDELIVQQSGTMKRVTAKEMIDTIVPALPDATSVAAADEVIVNQSGVSKRATINEVITGALDVPNLPSASTMQINDNLIVNQSGTLKKATPKFVLDGTIPALPNASTIDKDNDEILIHQNSQARRLTAGELFNSITPQLDDASSVNTTDELIVHQSGTAKKATAQELFTQQGIWNAVVPSLTDATTVASSDQFIVHQGGTAKRATADEFLNGTATVTASGSTAGRTLRDRFADVANVKDYGAVGDGVTDDTAAFQNAVTANAFVVVPETASEYIINDTINVPEGHIVWGLGKPTLRANCSAKSATPTIGRNCFKLNSYSQVHNFKLRCFNNLFTSPADGQYHAAISIGKPWVGTGQTDTLKEHIVVKNVEIISDGAANMHAIDCWGYVERCQFENITASGKYNFVFVQHWSADTSVEQSHLTSKSWHPAHITWKHCVAQSNVTGARGFRISGGAWIKYEHCIAHTDRGFDAFPGDRGGFYAQNINGADVLAGIEYTSCISTDPSLYAFQIGGNGNQGSTATPSNLIWYGSNYNSSLTMRDCRMVINTAGLDPDPLVASFIDKLEVEGCELRNKNAGVINYSMQFAAINQVSVNNTVATNPRGIIARYIDNLSAANCVLSADVPDYTTTTTGVAFGSYSYVVTLASALTEGDTTLYINPNTTTNVTGATASASTDTITKTSHGFVNGEKVRFTSLNPETKGGLNINQIYYVVGATANTFQVSDENGGAVVDILINYTDMTVRGQSFLLTKGSKLTTVGAPTSGVNVVEVLNTVSYEDETGPIAVKIKPSPITVASGSTLSAYTTVNNVNITGCRIEGYKYGIRSGGQNPNYNWNVSDCNFSAIGIYGIDINNAQNIVIDGCTFGLCNFENSVNNYTIRIGQYCKNVNVSNNMFRDNFKSRYTLYFHPDVTGGVIAANVFLTPPHNNAGTDASILLDPSYSNSQWPIISDNYYGPLVTRPWYGAATTHPSPMVISSGAVTVLGSTAPPLVLIDTEPATATATISAGAVSSVTVTGGSAGYTSPPAVTFNGGGGSGAVAVATLTGDVVSSISVSNGGSGYTSSPTVSIAAPPVDDLNTINGGTEGQIIVCGTFNSARDVTFKDATGNLQLAGDFVSDVSQDTITLIKRGSNWWELSRSNNSPVSFASGSATYDPPSLTGNVLTGTATYDPPSLADGAGTTQTVTVTGAALGDFAEATFSNDLQGIILTAWVSAINTVSVRFQNESGGPLDLSSGTLTARVLRANGGAATTTVTVTGAALGDYAEASFSLDLQGIVLTAWVSATNTVTVRFQNNTGGTIDLASGTLRARVFKP